MYPSLNLRIRVKASPLDFQHEPVDLAIYYCREPHPDMHNELILEEHLTPVCTPHYAKEHRITGDISSLQNATFIHYTESLDSACVDYEWQFWLKGQHHQLELSDHYYVLNHAEMAVSAIRNNMGIGIGRQVLVQPYVDSGELIAPFTSIPADMSCYLICSKGMEHRRKYTAFTQWIIVQSKPN